MIPAEELQQIPLFSALDPEALAHVAPLFHRVRYRLGSVIFSQGAPGDAFYILEAGTLRVRHVDARGQESVLDYYQAPRIFGETSLLTGVHHDATVDVFSGTAELSVLQKTEFDVLLTERPEIKEQLNIRTDVKQKLSARTFKWLSDGEYVVVSTRRHRIALILMLRLPVIVAGVILFVAGLITVLNAASAGAFSILAPISTGLWILLAIWILGSFIWTIVDWSNDYFIVTNKRVIHIEKVVGFFEEREEAPVEQVADVQESSLSVLARVFAYSDIRVETAGHQIDINFSFVPRRLHIPKNIFEQVERIRSRSQFEKREQLRAGIREELQKYITPPEAGGKAVPSPVPASITLAADAPPPPVHWQRRSSLGKRLNALFGLRIEEKGSITWRKHWFDLVSRTGKWVGVFVLIGALGPIILITTWSQSAPLARLLVGAIWFAAVNVAGFFVWYQYEDWRNDIYQVTDDRILDVERSPFRFKERSVETTLDRVQNVSYNKPNLLANFFDFGDLTIETAGGQGQLVFMKVSNPQWAAQEIFRRRDAHRERLQQDQIRRERAEYLDWFLEYHRLLQHQGDVQVPQTARPAAPSAASSDELPPEPPPTSTDTPNPKPTT